jgi:Cytochrome c554 and c-prime
VSTRRTITLLIVLSVIVFLGWRFVRPMNIFVVDDRFAWPVDTSQAPAILGDLSAEGCAVCHQAFYDEWRTTIHSQAWTDPYFQTDWQFDGSQHICRLCHTPLDRQQPHTVLAYRDKDKWDPVLEDNPAFDKKLQHEGVTCAACHYRDGKIVGVLGVTDVPHPVKKLDDPNQVCVRCHIVEGERWDTFFRFPPCGTVAEIESTLATSRTGEVTAIKVSELGCVQCHMPSVNRPLVEGGVVRNARQHLWRGGHDPQIVKKALTIEFTEGKQLIENKRVFSLSISNTGAAHYVPTGTPDRYLTVQLRLLDVKGAVLDEQTHAIKRTVMWRPFIVDLWDTRLPRGQLRQYELEVPADNEAVTVEAEVRYYLLNEKRRERINYENTTPINYEIYRKQISLR